MDFCLELLLDACQKGRLARKTDARCEKSKINNNKHNTYIKCLLLFWKCRNRSFLWLQRLWKNVISTGGKEKSRHYLPGRRFMKPLCTTVYTLSRHKLDALITNRETGPSCLIRYTVNLKREPAHHGTLELPPLLFHKTKVLSNIRYLWGNTRLIVCTRKVSSCD